MQPVASWLLASILGLLSALHIYWASGGRWASQVTIPQRVGGAALFHPGAVATLGVAFLLLIGALIVITPFDPRFKVILLRAIAVIFGLRAVGDFHYVGLFKRAVDSPFAYWDTRLYSPLCLAIGVLALILSTSQPSKTSQGPTGGLRTRTGLDSESAKPVRSRDV